MADALIKNFKEFARRMSAAGAQEGYEDMLQRLLTAEFSTQAAADGLNVLDDGTTRHRGVLMFGTCREDFWHVVATDRCAEHLCQQMRDLAKGFVMLGLESGGSTAPVIGTVNLTKYRICRIKVGAFGP